MKTIILTLVLYLLFFTNLSSQWEVINEGFKGRGINTIDFVNENTGWLAGPDNMLLKTLDGGLNWNDILLEESWSINHLDFINESIGWAVVSRSDSIRNYAVIAKSLDKGFTWQVQKQINDIVLSRIFIINENNAFAIGDKIFNTSDGGINWSNRTPQYNNTYYYTIWFRDSLNGMVIGNSYDGSINLNTTDGGINWYKKNASVSVNGLQIINDSTGYFFYQNDTITCFCRTDDMLSSWKVLSEIDGNMFSFQAVDTDLVYAIGSFREGTLIKSTDGGNTWQNLTSGNYAAEGMRNGMYIFGKNLGFIIGYIDPGGGPFLFRSTDLEDWELQRFSFPLNDVSFFNRDKVLIVGGWPAYQHFPSGGCMFTTNNGGSKWIVNRPFGYHQSCLFLDANTAFVSGRSILKTFNSGNTWIEYSLSDTLGNFFRPSDICFADINTGFAAGRYWESESESSSAGIMQTTDQGETWELIFRYPYVNDIWYHLFSICFTGTTGWAVGEGGMILKYTPQTSWVKKDSLTDLPLNKVFFTDQNHGWIAGGGVFTNRILLRTTNSGETWQTDKKLGYLINDFWFIDNLQGWAVGNDSLGKGVILESIDGGETWTVEMDNLIAPLKSIYIKDNCAWTVGDNGLILRNTNTGAVWVEDENDNSFPTEFVLEQNYPNPFNPVTKISWQSPVSSHQTLKVYDVLGNEVATLVDEYREAGRYEVEFQSTVSSRQSAEGSQQLASRPGSALTSGIYLYRLEAGSYAETKKMILLK